MQLAKILGGVMLDERHIDIAQPENIDQIKLVDWSAPIPFIRITFVGRSRESHHTISGIAKGYVGVYLFFWI